jgi:hypothetical protein
MCKRGGGSSPLGRIGNPCKSDLYAAVYELTLRHLRSNSWARGNAVATFAAIHIWMRDARELPRGGSCSLDGSRIEGRLPVDQAVSSTARSLRGSRGRPRQISRVFTVGHCSTGRFVLKRASVSPSRLAEGAITP